MTPDDFRDIALSLPNTEERSHTGHPDFRVGGKIFATLGPKLDWGMAKLTPDQQQEFMQLDASFQPAAGKWGLGGATTITLADANPTIVRNAVAAAWETVSRKR